MANLKAGKKRYSASRTAGKKQKKSQRIRRILVTILIFLVVAATLFFLVLRSGDNSVSISENALGSIITPIQNAFSSVSGGVKNLVTKWRNYDTLQDEYDALTLENEQLNMQLASMNETTSENERLQTLLDAKNTYSALDPIYAKVIARDAGPWFETFSLNRGTNNGVGAGMAVVNGEGLIGRVFEVGLNYSKVISIIDSRSAVACLVQRTRDNGIMRGQASASDSVAECNIYYLPNINSITPGDTVITSGTDSLYPKGLRIGVVTAVSLDAGADGTYAVMTPSVDFQRIEDVFILRTEIETDTDVLPSVVTATPIPTASPTPDPNATPSTSPEATDGEPYWSRPTPTPAGGSNNPVTDLIEDVWANGN